MKWLNKNKKQQRFRNWISDYHGSLYKHALWMTGNQDLAQDMVQETYYQAWSSVAKLQDPDKALPWLLTILRRVIYREQRCQYRHDDTVAELRQLDQGSAQPDAYALLEIYRMLENLSHNQREVLLLYNMHGFSYEEISGQLRIPIGTVMSRINRARAALRDKQRSEDAKVIHLNQVKRGSGSDG